MTSKTLRLALCILLFSLACACARHHSEKRDTLWQFGTIQALLFGVYDGELPCAEIARHGNLGLGTFDSLDGELILFNGTVYQAKLDGTLAVADPEIRIPYIAETFFEAKLKIPLAEFPSLDALQKKLDASLPSLNQPYAFRIAGSFSKMKTRSVPKQSRPFPPLGEAVKNQKILEQENVRGTLLGFRCPDIFNGIGVGGYHFHFISEDLKIGGHVLDCAVTKAEAEADVCDQIVVVMPRNEGFLKKNFSGDKKDELEKAERGK